MIRSVAEWSLVIALLLTAAYAASPGRDAAQHELQFLLSREKPTQAQLARAASILTLAQHGAPARGEAILAALLRSDETRVRRRALDLLRDQVKYQPTYVDVFRAWETEQSPRTLAELSDRVLPIRALIAEIETRATDR